MPTCSVCHWSSPGDDPTCGHCGAAYPGLPQATPYAESPVAPPSGLACPHCGDLAEVRKLTAIVSGGTASTVASTGLSANTKTALVRQLAPPPSPAQGCLIPLIGESPKLYRARVERHRRQMQRWMKLYYCGRCDVVFDPEEREFAALPIWRQALLADAGGPAH